MKRFLSTIYIFITSIVFSQSDSTEIAMTLNNKINGKSNVIYCSTIELLWREMINYLGEEPLPLISNPEIIELNRIAKELNSPIENEFWFANVGLVKNGIIDTIKSAYKNQFNIDWKPIVVKDADLLGFAYLQKNIEFFSRLDHDFRYFKFKDSIRVKSFGLEYGWTDPEYKVQIKIHDYINQNDFIVQIGSKDSLDEIYFAKIAPKSNLKETYNEVIRRINLPNCIEYLEEYDDLLIPYLSFDINNSFQQFKHVEFSSKKHPLLISKELTQNIKFDLNQKGIQVQSTSISTEIFGVDEVTVKPKYYAFNQPFLIILKRKGESNPYFLYWVQNAEHMQLLE